MEFNKYTKLAALGFSSVLLVACEKAADETASTDAETAVTSEAAQASEVPVADIVAIEKPEVAEPEALKIESFEDRASYGIGFNIGSNMVTQTEIKISEKAILAGMEDALAGKSPRISEEAIKSAFEEIQKRASNKETQAAQANMSEAQAFLEKNAERPEVKVTPSGLQYEVLSESDNPDAPSPQPSDKVTVHYHGTMIDGTIFDSSIDRGEPITFPVTGVIPGWVEALQMMKVGDKWKIFLPPPLAYGSRQTGSIPANSALIFTVELLGIESSEE